MEREARKSYHTRGSASGNGGTAAERYLLLRWGNRKRLRCVKVHRRDVQAAATAAAEKAAATQRRAAAAVAVQHHVIRNSEDTGPMRPSVQQQQNNVIHMIASRDREHPVRDGSNSNNGNLPASPDNVKDSSSGSEGSVWPKFVVALTNKEKVEDFLMFKGSRPSHRPKKRAKVIQETINLVCPGTWLCDLSLERYEVREQKVLKKRPRGLRAMQNVDSGSE